MEINRLENSRIDCMLRNEISGIKLTFSDYNVIKTLNNLTLLHDLHLLVTNTPTPKDKEISSQEIFHSP